jgi:threonine dehydratase
MGSVVDSYIVVTLEETKRAVRPMAKWARVISEGAGALPLAAAVMGEAGQGPTMAIVRGGEVRSERFHPALSHAHTTVRRPPMKCHKIEMTATSRSR